MIIIIISIRIINNNGQYSIILIISIRIIINNINSLEYLNSNELFLSLLLLFG